MESNKDPFDLDNIRVEVDEAHFDKIREWQLAHPRRAGRGRRVANTSRYLVGKYDIAWFVAADRARAPLLAVVLRHLQRMWASRHPEQPDIFPVTTLAVERFGFDEQRKRRGLCALAAAGLIKIQGRAHANPLVTIVELAPEASE